MKDVTVEIKKKSSLSFIPGHIWKQRPFKFKPEMFAPESERLKKIPMVSPQVQWESLSLFRKDPDTPMVYCVSGMPDDAQAKYFAAYLTELHCEYKSPQANVVWEPLFSDYHNNLLRKNDLEGPSMLVLYNLTPNSQPTKLEKARDLLEKFTSIPRVIVVAGEDPYSFMMTRLFLPFHGIAFFNTKVMSNRVEII